MLPIGKPPQDSISPAGPNFRLLSLPDISTSANSHQGQGESDRISVFQMQKFETQTN